MAGALSQLSPALQLWQGARAWARLCCAAGRGWGRALTCHSASPGGRSPAPSPSHRRWSGKAQSPARKQKEAWVSPESRAEGESLPCVARAAERELKAGRAQPWLLQIARSSCHFCRGGGICFSAHTTRSNRCSGASWIPPSPNQTSGQLRRHLQHPAARIKWTWTFSALSLGKPSRVSEAKLPLPNFRAAPLPLLQVPQPALRAASLFFKPHFPSLCCHVTA